MKLNCYEHYPCNELFITHTYKMPSLQDNIVCMVGPHCSRANWSRSFPFDRLVQFVDTNHTRKHVYAVLTMGLKGKTPQGAIDTDCFPITLEVSESRSDGIHFRKTILFRAWNIILLHCSWYLIPSEMMKSFVRWKKSKMVRRYFFTLICISAAAYFLLMISSWKDKRTTLLMVPSLSVLQSHAISE